VAEPAFKAAIARASQAAEEARALADRKAHGPNGSHGRQGDREPVPQAPTQPDYGAPAGWYAPGWPPQQQPPGYWHPPAQPPQQQPYWGPQSAQGYPGQAQPMYPPYPPYPPAGQSDPDAQRSPDQSDDEVSRSNPPAHG
jgi:cell division protease FtsH